MKVAVVTPVPTVKLAVGGALPASWLAGDTLHDDVVDTILLADVINRRNVGMVELGQRQRFAAEARARRISAENPRSERLEGGQPFQLLVASAIDNSHATRADFFDQPVVR